MTVKMRECPNCGGEIYADSVVCMHCRQAVPKQTGICSVCGRKTETEFIRDKEYCKSDFIDYINKVILSSTQLLDGYRIKEYVGIETATIVIGTGVLAEFTSDISDFFGARSSAFERKLVDAKNGALDRLKLVARSRGANAVIGVSINFTEFTSNRIGLMAYGTIVKVDKV